MNRKIKILIAGWFIFSWAVIVIFTLKPLGVIKTLGDMRKNISRLIYRPEVLNLADFDKQSQLSAWLAKGAGIGLSPEHARRAGYSAKVTYYAGMPMRSLILEDYDFGPSGERDWSGYRALKVNIYNPNKAREVLHIKVKDSSGREKENEISLMPGENDVAVLLDDIGQFVDLKNIVYLNFFAGQLREDMRIYLDDLRLEKERAEPAGILKRPQVKLIAVNYPKQVKNKETIKLSFSIELNKAVSVDYKFFIHITERGELRKPPAKRARYINADQEPWIPTSRWSAGQAYEIGPVFVYIPEDSPEGEYVIQAGLFNPNSHGAYQKGSSYGMMDFRGSYPRLRYVNRNIRDYIVARFKLKR